LIDWKQVVDKNLSVEVTIDMNEYFYKSVIEDRQREVHKIVQDNQINRHYWDAASSQLESTGQVKNALGSWLLIVAKRIKSIFAIANKGSIKA
jgi:hypothetical protein